MKLHRRIYSAACMVLITACAGSAPNAPAPGVDRDPSGRKPPTVPPFDPSATFRRIVPTDQRAVRRAESPPPAISGGTLLVSSDGTQAFVADPDRDRISVVDIAGRAVLHAIALRPGDEPGRLAQDDLGRVHVALRRGNAVATIDPASGTLLGRHETCVAPRGIAFDATARLLHVACASGELVSLAAETGEVARRISLGADLRDVMVSDGRLLVTRFKSAELIELDAEGAVLATRTPPIGHSIFPELQGRSVLDALVPRIAWRAAPGSAGEVLMANQLARSGEIALPETAEDGEANEPVDVIAPGGSAYGGAGGGSCSGVVQTELTLHRSDGSVAAVRINATLPVDVAISPVDGTVALANAGARDPEQPQVEFQHVSSGSGVVEPPLRAPMLPSFPVQLLGDFSSATIAANGDPIPCQAGFDGVAMEGQAVAVAFMPDGTLLVQSREPDELAIVDVRSGSRLPPETIALGGRSVYDTGHEIFHRDPGGGVACASCHAEGGDDGHVWNFSTLGPRRTQSVSVGLAGTAPFHWQGDMHDLSMLMEEVLVGRMGGVHQSPDRASALQDWLFALQPPPSPRSADDPAAERGRALFEGQAQCASCHSGAKLTDNRTVDVGTGEPLQVPSLVGVAYRAPFIHDGCAATLRERFDPTCGGDAHGNTAELTSEQVDDLVAYLESL